MRAHGHHPATSAANMVFMRAFERFVRWNVSDNVKVGICVSIIMGFAVSPHIGAPLWVGRGRALGAWVALHGTHVACVPRDAGSV